MDSLIFVAVIFYVAYTLVNSSKKAAKMRRDTEARKARRDAPEGQGSGGEHTRPAAQPTPRPAARKSKPQPVAARPQGAPGEGMSTMSHSLQMRMEDAPKPRLKRQEYTGSLGVGSTEGEDLCDASLGHHDMENEEFYKGESVYENQIGGAGVPRWDARSVVQGVVMSEILKRPSQRQWGKIEPWKN